MQDRIEKVIELRAPIGRVWRALTDHKQFGIWFRVNIDGSFVAGEVARGHTTFPGYEGLKWEVTVQAIEHERLFSFTWCPYAHDDKRDYSTAPRTLVEFTLEPTKSGTRLTISESGFLSLPDDQLRFDALRSNAQGWILQADSLIAFLRDAN